MFVWKTSIDINLSPIEVYKIPMTDLLGMWKTKEGKYDQMTYGYEIDNLENFKRKFNAN